MDNDSYLIGPESNHSMIKSRVHQNRNGSEDDRYMLMHRDRVMVEDLEEGNGGNNKFDKKRNIKRVANSTNYRA
jgi:hypothetical protein